MHRTLLFINHLVTQGYPVGILMRIGIGKDGLSEKTGCIGMNQIAPIATKQHEVGIGIRMLSRGDGLSQLAERQVGRDNPYHATIFRA